MKWIKSHILLSQAQSKSCFFLTKLQIKLTLFIHCYKLWVLATFMEYYTVLEESMKQPQYKQAKK